jgi:GMP synthase (glutamine-hydrolysing)
MSQVWIVDFGSQYTQLITRRSRELGHSSIIITVEETIKKIDAGEKPQALVLSGGPQSVFEDETDYSKVFGLNIPVLGICYGMQIISQYFKGTVEVGIQGEYGNALIHGIDHELPGNAKSLNVWMSHSDHVTVAPENFDVILRSENELIAGVKHNDLPILGLQFHPEVEHTQNGREILNYFFNDIASLSKDWSNTKMLEECMSMVEPVRGKKVLCAFSGGVDSLVAATLAHKILGDDLHCFFIDNGLLRPQDYDHIKLLQDKMHYDIQFVDAQSPFLDKLEGEADPEKKRKIIGTTFIEIFEQKVHEYEETRGIKFDYLLQGTLYPDVIESISPHQKGGKSVTIKSHHNVGGLPERMKLQLLEPLKYLFKDEVREMGEELGLNPEWVHRHPFPGPGIGVRVLGAVSRESVRKVQESDQILFEELKSKGLYDSTWQAFTVLLPVKTVGVKGDSRAYEEVICLRMVNSTDGMTATVTQVPYEFLEVVSSRICNEVKGITRVVYDVTSKPPGTIEWE